MCVKAKEGMLRVYQGVADLSIYLHIVFLLLHVVIATCGRVFSRHCSCSGVWFCHSPSPPIHTGGRLCTVYRSRTHHDVSTTPISAHTLSMVPPHMMQCRKAWLNSSGTCTCGVCTAESGDEATYQVSSVTEFFQLRLCPMTMDLPNVEEVSQWDQR